MNFIRIMGTDIKAESTLLYGLSKIKGVNIMASNGICTVLKLDKTRKVSSLSEKEIETLENYLSSGEFTGLPLWLSNLRKDPVTGNDMHLVGKDLDYYKMQLERKLSKIKTYRGLRLRLRLPVRGQRTKANFRRNKTIAAMKSKSGGKK